MVFYLSALRMRVSCGQTQPGSFSRERKEPGNEVDIFRICVFSLKQGKIFGGFAYKIKEPRFISHLLLAGSGSLGQDVKILPNSGHSRTGSGWARVLEEPPVTHAHQILYVNYFINMCNTSSSSTLMSSSSSTSSPITSST